MASSPTDPERWKRVDAILAGALALAGDERERFLARECAADAGLRAEIDSLLSGEARAAGFLDPESSPLAAPPSPDGEDDPWIGRRVGGFVLKRPLGAGGMGAVYAAWQEKPGREVAVKVMRQRLARAADVRRFEHEAAILGRLRHPCIAHLYDSGLVDDPRFAGELLPYFAMEIVPDARTLTEHARAEDLDLEERLQLFLQVCDGVHHAHQRGVLHRDLKPSNLIVDAEGRPRVIDFGIARALDVVAGEATQTRPGALLGTLQYMSPQQCGDAAEEVDVRSDVYSLGLVLYELVTDARPYDVTDTTLYEAVRVIREQPPRRPSRVNPACRGDLEVVLLKALEKSADARYPSVSELAEDVRRVVAREPINARRPGLVHRAALFARRNPLAASSLAAAVLALVGGGVTATYLAIREGRALRAAEQRERIANAVNDFLNEDLLGSIDPNETANPEIRVRDALDRAARRVEERFADEPRVEAAISHSIGRAYASIGLPGQGLPFIERSRALLAAEYGEQSVQVARTEIDLAQCRLKLGDYAETEGLIRGVLERLPAGAGESRGKAIGVLADVERKRGSTEAALRLYEQSRELLERALGPDDLDVLITDANIASAHAELGHFEEAERLQSALTERSRRAIGEETPLAVQALANLALTRQSLGRLDQARELFEQALELGLRVQGPEHTATLTTRRNLGLVHLLQGRLEDAERETRLALDGFRRALSDEHLSTLAAELVLGQTLFRRARVDEAEELLVDTHERARVALGPDHAVTQELALHVARCLAARGEEAEAIELLAAVLDEREHPDAPSEATLALLNYQGSLLLDEARPDEAEPVLAEVVEGMRATMGTHPGTAVALRNYGRCLVQLERKDEARSALTEAQAMARELFGDGHDLTRQVSSLLAQLGELSN